MSHDARAGLIPRSMNLESEIIQHKGSYISRVIKLHKEIYFISLVAGFVSYRDSGNNPPLGLD